MGTNDSYWLEHTRNCIVLPANTKVVAHLVVRWRSPFCNPILSLDLTVSSQAIEASTCQVCCMYCSRSVY